MLEVKNVKFWYQPERPPLIYDCSFSIVPREFLAIVGESGGGKTTLLHLCCGLLQAHMLQHPEYSFDLKGEVCFKQEQVEKPLPAFAYVPQRFDIGLHPMKTAEENVLMAVSEDGNSDQERDHARRLMEMCGIIDQAQINVRRLSGGQKQRVAICRALITDPAVLFMDEPFANLDFTLKPSMGKLLCSLRERYGLSLLLVTHDIEGAVALADKVLGVKQTYGIPLYKTWRTEGQDSLTLRREIEEWIRE